MDINGKLNWLGPNIHVTFSSHITFWCHITFCCHVNGFHKHNIHVPCIFGTSHLPCLPHVGLTCRGDIFHLWHGQKLHHTLPVSTLNTINHHAESSIGSQWPQNHPLDIQWPLRYPDKSPLHYSMVITRVFILLNNMSIWFNGKRHIWHDDWSLPYAVLIFLRDRWLGTGDSLIYSTDCIIRKLTTTILRNYNIN